MAEPARRFDDLLGSVRADELKAMVIIWGGKASLRKEACIALIRQGLADPAKVRAAVDRLDPYERAALALVKQAGGAVEYRLLGLGLLALGVVMPARFYREYANVSEEATRALIKRGVLLSASTYDPGHLPSSSYGSTFVFADERLLAAVDTVEPKPFAIAAASPPATST